MQQRYEYDVVQTEVAHPISQLPKTLNDYAKLGWQVISIKWQSDQSVLLVLERPINSTHAPELLNMPIEIRNQILAESAELALADYLYDAELTDFEAFGENDYYDDTP